MTNKLQDKNSYYRSYEYNNSIQLFLTKIKETKNELLTKTKYSKQIHSIPLIYIWRLICSYYSQLIAVETCYLCWKEVGTGPSELTTAPSCYHMRNTCTHRRGIQFMCVHVYVWFYFSPLKQTTFTVHTKLGSLLQFGKQSANLLF